MNPAVNSDILIRVKVMVEDAKKRLQTLNKQVNQTTRLTSQAWKGNEMRFQGWAMSIMFFGMAIQRIFMSIWKSSTKVFQDVMHSVEGSVTSFDRLASVGAYLGFVMGQALEPIAEMLVPIIEKVALWVEEHPKLTRAIVAGGVVIGTFLMVLGALVLGLAGLVSAVKNAIAIIQVLKYVLGTASVSAKAFGASLTSGLALAGIIGGIILAIAWIWRLKEQIGGWGEFFKSVLRGILRIGAIVAAGLGAAFGVALEGIKRAINWLIQQYNKIAGKFGLGRINTLGGVTGLSFKEMYGEIAGNLFDRIDSSRLAPEQGYATNANPLDLKFRQPANTYNINIGEVKTGDPLEFIRLMQEQARYS